MIDTRGLLFLAMTFSKSSMVGVTTISLLYILSPKTGSAVSTLFRARKTAQAMNLGPSHCERAVSLPVQIKPACNKIGGSFPVSQPCKNIPCWESNVHAKQVTSDTCRRCGALKTAGTDPSSRRCGEPVCG